jgi:small subunit ribosomal protein S2
MSAINTENLRKIGAHYGYTKTRRHPSVKPFIKATSGGVDFIDLDKSVEQYSKAVAFLKSVTDANKQVVFVGTKPEMKQVIKEIALAANMPYIADRYIGGIFTNYPEMKKRIEKLHNTLKQKEEGALSVYTKKEQLLINLDIKRLDKNFGGVSSLNGMPGALIIVDTKKEFMCVDEAIRMRIPVIGLCNTDTDINKIDYPILVNEGPPTVVKEILTNIKKSIV